MKKFWFRKPLALAVGPKEGIYHCASVLLLFSTLYIVFFSPALFSGHILAPGDAFYYYLPSLYSQKTAWDTFILAGFPTMADPQVMAWYPVAMIFSYLRSYNGFLLSAYVLASCFSYGYVYTLTRSRLAGTVGGIAYGMCGFMFAHLGHATIVHAAAWMPLIFWALESLRRNFSPLWLAIGSFAVACCFLAGHPQIFVYALYLSAAYILTQGWNAQAGIWRYFYSSFLMLGLGVGLTAIQLLPTLELASLSVREHLSFAGFVSYALPPRQIPMLFFPNIFGGSTMPGTSATYFGEWNLTEVSGYVGILPLILATIGASTAKRKSLSFFWVCTGSLAFLLALGEATPLARLTYHLPAISKFRCPGRHFIELALAVSVLAGLGVAAIHRQEVSARRTQIGALIISVTMIVLLGVVLWAPIQLQQRATENGIGEISLKPWMNPALGAPLVILLATVAALLYWYRRPRSSHRIGILLALLILDLSSFGWFSYWRDQSPTPANLRPQLSAQRYRPLLEASNQRILPLRGILGSVDEIMPNISRMWGIPSASGHGVFALARYCELSSMRPDGGGNFSDEALRAEDQSLNLLAVRYLFLPSGKIEAQNETQLSGAPPPNWVRTYGINWPEKDIDVSLGSGCDVVSPGPIRLELSESISATKIGIVSWLGCSTQIKDGTAVVRITITSVDNKPTTFDLIAGRDTSEWAYDCSDVRSKIQHQRASVFSSFPVERRSCEGHRYLAMLPLAAETKVKSIELEWLENQGVFTLRKLGLINEQSQLANFLQSASAAFLDTTRWVRVEDIGSASVYENLKAMPRAWLVSETATLSPEEMLKTIKTSRLPDGRPFDPRRIALIDYNDNRFALTSVGQDANASAQVVRLSNTSLEVRTAAMVDSHLVTSDVYYPGWVASLDGKPASLLRTNYALRGVPVPAGNHLVRFEFKSRTLRYGAVLTAASLIVLFSVRVLTRVRNWLRG